MCDPLEDFLKQLVQEQQSACSKLKGRFPAVVPKRKQVVVVVTEVSTFCVSL